ncbi:hypothetical protein ACFLTS_04390 [Chloroflexota bacterium]
MLQENEGTPVLRPKTEGAKSSKGKKQLVKSSWGVIGIFSAFVAIFLLIVAFIALAFNIGGNKTMLEFLIATAVCAGIATIALKQTD